MCASLTPLSSHETAYESIAWAGWSPVSAVAVMTTVPQLAVCSSLDEGHKWRPDTNGKVSLLVGTCYSSKSFSNEETSRSRVPDGAFPLLRVHPICWSDVSKSVRSDMVSVFGVLRRYWPWARWTESGGRSNKRTFFRECSPRRPTMWPQKRGCVLVLAAAHLFLCQGLKHRNSERKKRRALLVVTP